MTKKLLAGVTAFILTFFLFVAISFEYLPKGATFIEAIKYTIINIGGLILFCVVLEIILILLFYFLGLFD